MVEGNSRVKRLLPLLLALLLSSPASMVKGDTYGPRFVSANAATSGAWYGYTAKVQVRPAGTVSSILAVWPGGYMSDGLFVQNGMLMPGTAYSLPGEALIFAWATYNTASSSGGPVPLVWISVPNATLYSWYTFQLTHSAVNDKWYFRYQDPAGVWHTQGAFAGNGRTLYSFGANTEYWSAGTETFGTQAMQAVRVYSGSSWVLTSTAYGPPASQCGHETIQSATPGNLVFKAVEGQCVPYAILW